MDLENFTVLRNMCFTVRYKLNKTANSIDYKYLLFNRILYNVINGKW